MATPSNHPPYPSAPRSAEDVAHVVDLCRQQRHELDLTWPGLGLLLPAAAAAATAAATATATATAAATAATTAAAAD